MIAVIFKEIKKNNFLSEYICTILCIKLIDYISELV